MYNKSYLKENILFYVILISLISWFPFMGLLQSDTIDNWIKIEISLILILLTALILLIIHFNILLNSTKTEDNLSKLPVINLYSKIILLLLILIGLLCSLLFLTFLRKTT